MNEAIRPHRERAFARDAYSRALGSKATDRELLTLAANLGSWTARAEGRPPGESPRTFRRRVMFCDLLGSTPFREAAIDHLLAVLFRGKPRDPKAAAALRALTPTDALTLRRGALLLAKESWFEEGRWRLGRTWIRSKGTVTRTRPLSALPWDGDAIWFFLRARYFAALEAALLDRGEPLPDDTAADAPDLEAVECLTPGQRAVMRLALRRMTAAEIGQELGISAQAVRVRKHEARKALRRAAKRS